MSIVACYNLKGGVGKTATAVNLAYLSAREGVRTLLWDLDAQGAASFYFRVKPRVKEDLKALVKGKVDLDAVVKGTDYEGLDLLPADFSYRHMDLELDGLKNSAKRFGKFLASAGEEYRQVVLDCPPGISLVSENVFYAADVLLVPLIPTTLSLRTLEQIRVFIGSAKVPTRKLRIVPFLTMVDRRKNLHRDIATEYAEGKDGFLRTQIPFASAVEKMGLQQAPLCAYDAGCPAAKAYEALWAELKALM